MTTEIRKCLVIVDLQHGFNVGDDDAVIEAVRNRVDRAINNGHYIIVLEYAGRGKTVDTIEESLLEDTPHLIKYDNSGCNAISEHLESEDIEITDEFIMTGINLPWCVGETAVDLAECFPELGVIIDFEACDDYSSGDKKIGVSHFLNRYKNSGLVDIVYNGQGV